MVPLSTPAAVLYDVFCSIPLCLSSTINLEIFFNDGHASGHTNSLRYVHWCAQFSNYILWVCFYNPFMIINCRGVYLLFYDYILQGYLPNSFTISYNRGVKRIPYTIILLITNLQYPPQDPPNGPKLKGFSFNLQNNVMPSTAIHTKSSISHTLTH